MVAGALAKEVVDTVKESKLPRLPRDTLVTGDPTPCVHMVWSQKSQVDLLEGNSLVLGRHVGLNEGLLGSQRDVLDGSGQEKGWGQVEVSKTLFSFW